MSFREESIAKWSLCTHATSRDVSFFRVVMHERMSI